MCFPIYYQIAYNFESSSNTIVKSSNIYTLLNRHTEVLDFAFIYLHDCETSIRQDCSCSPVYDSFVEILDGFNLVQIVTEPTRHDNVLDLILTSNPILVSKVDCIPGLSDHDIVSTEVAIKPTQAKQKRRTIHLYNKADWTTFR